MKLFFIVLIFLSVQVFCQRPVLLSDVHELHFSSNHYTTNHRTAPVLQLKCVGGSGWRYVNQIKYGYCFNLNYGTNYMDPKWKCTITAPDNTYVESTTVVCEGYNYANDPYITEGSCSLEYQLIDKNPTFESESHSLFIGMFFMALFAILLCGCFVRHEYRGCGCREYPIFHQCHLHRPTVVPVYTGGPSYCSHQNRSTGRSENVTIADTRRK